MTILHYLILENDVLFRYHFNFSWSKFLFDTFTLFNTCERRTILSEINNDCIKLNNWIIKLNDILKIESIDNLNKYFTLINILSDTLVI